MRLIELRLKNLNSLKGEWHIDFSDTAFINEGIFAITGQTGAGKTTILDAICLALYGETPRINSISKSSNEVMTRQTAECSAEVVIDLNGNHYRCRWGQRRAYNKADGNLQDATHEIAKINLDDVSKPDDLLESTLKHTKNKIIELTRMDFQQFTRSILLAQGSFSAFLKAKADERADILEKITGTDIYATISAHVHDKKRAEEDILSKLQYGLDGLMLLDANEEKQLKSDLQSYQQAQSKQQQMLQTLDKKIQWLDSVTELKDKRQLYHNNLEKAQQAQQDFIPDAKRLAAANKALEIDSQFSQLVNNRDNLKRLQKDQQQISHTLPQQEDNLAQATVYLKTVQGQVQTASDALQAALPNIKAARKLDVDIAQHAHSIKDVQQRQQTLATNAQGLRQEINHHTNEAQRNTSQLTKIETQLDDAHAFNDIESDIANFEAHCGRLKVLLQDNAALAKDKKAQQNQIAQHQTSLDRLYEQQKEQEATKAITQDTLKAIQQEQAALTESQSVADMRTEQEQIDHISSQVEQVSFKRQQLNTLYAQSKKTKTDLPAIHDELTKLTSAIHHTESALQIAKDKRHDKQTQLHLLQKVAKLEDYIADLEDGHPCPLCGALEHPYRLNHPHLAKETEAVQTQRQITELDTTIADLEKTLSEQRIHQATAQHQLEQSQGQQTLLDEQIHTLEADLGQLISTVLNKTPSECLTAIIEPLSTLQQIETPTDSLALLNSIKTQLTQYRETLKNTLSHYETLNETISTIHKTTENLKQTEYQLASDINDIKIHIEVSSSTLKNLGEKFDDQFSELKTLTDAIWHLLTKYSAGTYQSDSITAIRALQHSLQPLIASIETQTILSDVATQAHIDTLRQQHRSLGQLKNQLNTFKEEQHALRTALGRIETQIETKQNQLNQNQEELDKTAQLVTDKTTVLNHLQKDRAQIFADKDPEEEDNRLRKALEQAQAEQITAQRQLDNTEYTLNQLLDKQKNLSEQITTVTDTLNTQENVFQSALAASDFIDEADFTAARLPVDERKALNQQQQHIDYALKQAKSLLDDTQKNLDDKQAHPFTTDDKATLTEQQRQAQDESNKRIESIGAISQQLKDNEDKKANQQAQLDAINTQKDKLQVWQQLHKLIGSSDGKKYRTFAQGLTFDLMVTHANTKLQKMSDRYLLIRDDDSPLELNVIDNYQGGEIRSTKNLSGGEGFIISLALALGLSQMASQNIRVDSLFLDEGFGTLDEESLDIALDTLTNLQQEGKLIGVISHVQALKDRILTQIKVEKLSGGFSQITGQGCQRISD
ncbi:AAA family ATPase [Psychrobacter sp. B38]|uniref:AAA family ATPase n=1 Tax=Psychrobacter sp. B38 TaxID=3143538 RepID=UPI00320CF794